MFCVFQLVFGLEMKVITFVMYDVNHCFLVSGKLKIAIYLF